MESLSGLAQSILKMKASIVQFIGLRPPPRYKSLGGVWGRGSRKLCWPPRGPLQEHRLGTLPLAGGCLGGMSSAGSLGIAAAVRAGRTHWGILLLSTWPPAPTPMGFAHGCPASLYSPIGRHWDSKDTMVSLRSSKSCVLWDVPNSDLAFVESWGT